MKRIIPIISAILLILFGSSIAFAATWEYKYPIYITDTSNTTRTYYPVMLGFPASQLSSYINANGLDTNMQIGDTDIKYMLVNSSNCTAVIPNLPAKATVQADLYTGYSPEQTSMAIVSGYGGYVTVSDNANLETNTDNWSVHIDNCYLGMDTGDYLINKPSSITANTSAVGVVTANITGISELIGNIAIADYYDIDIGQRDNYNQSYTYIDNALTLGGANEWYSQSFTSSANHTLYIVVLRLFRVGNPGTAYLSIRNADGSYLPIGANITVASTNANTLTTTTTGEWRIFEFAATGLSSGNKYAIVLNAPDSDITNKLGWCGNTNIGSYSGGLFSYSFDNITYTPASEKDMAFKEGSIQSYFNIEGVLQESENVSSLRTNNVNDWVFLNGIPVADSIKIYVGGVLQGWWEPNDIISGTTLPDRAGGDNPGVITWGTNSNISLDYGGQESYQSMSANATATGGFDTPQAFMPATWFAMGENVENLPFYPAVYGVVNSMDFPDVTEGVQTLYFVVIVGIAMAAFLGLVMFTRSAFIGFMCMVIILFIGSSMTIVPMWIPFSITLTGFGIMFLYRQVAY